MKTQKKTISRFLKEFVAFLFVLGMVLAMLAPITSAANGAGVGGQATGAGATTPGSTAQTSDAGTTSSQATTSKTSPASSPGIGVTQPGAYKDDYIYVPLNPANYSDFPKLSSTSPTGMLSEFANGLIKNAKYILGAVAVLYLMLAALKLIMSQGNDDTITKQKNALTYGIIGLLVIGL